MFEEKFFLVQIHRKNGVYTKGGVVRDSCVDDRIPRPEPETETEE